MEFCVRRFQEKDAEEAARVIGETLRVSNGPDYPPEIIEELAGAYSAGGLIERAAQGHLYVLLDGGRIVGSGGIAEYMGNPAESILLTVFVLPEYQGKGAGRKILEALEGDEYFLRADRVVIHSSVTAEGFYLKLGYGYRDGVSAPDGEGCVRMEKDRSRAI